LGHQNDDILKYGLSKKGVEKVDLSICIDISISNFRETITLKLVLLFTRAKEADLPAVIKLINFALLCQVLKAVDLYLKKHFCGATRALAKPEKCSTFFYSCLNLFLNCNIPVPCRIN
jgi:hypothetical protein